MSRIPFGYHNHQYAIFQLYFAQLALLLAKSALRKKTGYHYRPMLCQKPERRLKPACLADIRIVCNSTSLFQ
jgi:hypothetical protein